MNILQLSLVWGKTFYSRSKNTVVPNEDYSSSAKKSPRKPAPRTVPLAVRPTLCMYSRGSSGGSYCTIQSTAGMSNPLKQCIWCRYGHFMKKHTFHSWLRMHSVLQGSSWTIESLMIFITVQRRQCKAECRTPLGRMRSMYSCASAAFACPRTPRLDAPCSNYRILLWDPIYRIAAASPFRSR